MPSLIQEFGDDVHLVAGRSCYELHKSTASFDSIICDRASFLLKSAEIDAVNGQCFDIHPSFPSCRDADVPFDAC